MRRPQSRRAPIWLAGVACAALTGCGGGGGVALERGDRLLGEGSREAAIAEYRLALRQTGETPEVLLRLGHAYALSGDVDESLRYYEALLARDSSYRWQAAADLSQAARRALRRGATENMVRALEPLTSFQLELVPRDLRLALARHHGRDGEHGRALPLYLSVIHEVEDRDGSRVAAGSEADSTGSGADSAGSGADSAGHRADSVPTAAGTAVGEASVPIVVAYEIGRSYEELGGCVEAIPWFERYLAVAGRDAPEETSARWHLGNCLFLAADEDRSSGRPRSALEKLERMVELGVPQTVLDRAHYLRGELLLGLGRPERALEAYREVLRLNPSRSGFLVRRAEERIRDIRFGAREL